MFDDVKQGLIYRRGLIFQPEILHFQSYSNQFITLEMRSKLKFLNAFSTLHIIAFELLVILLTTAVGAVELFPPYLKTYRRTPVEALRTF